MRGLVIAASVPWTILLTGGLLLALLMVLVFRLLHRDPSVGRTRYGFFVEREKFGDEPPQTEPEQTLPWPAVPKKEE